MPTTLTAAPSVFDVRDAVFDQWQTLGVCGLAALIMVGAAWAGWRVEAGRKRDPRTTLCAFLWPLPLLVAAFFYVDFIGSRRQYDDALARGTAMVAEGTLCDLVPYGPGDHPPESFTLRRALRGADVHFRYARSDATPALHDSRGLRPPLRDGLRVRIAYVETRILRIELLSADGENLGGGCPQR